MRVRTGIRRVLLLLTLVPPAALALLGWPRAALGVLLALHAPILWGTLHPHSRLFGPVLTRLPGERRSVWLTFDDGPSADTPALLDLLDEFNARATFFLVGERAARLPELVREIRARGHDIGNHSHSHPAGWFWALPPGRLAADIAAAQEVLTGLSGARPGWFRAVAGHANPFVAPVLEQQGLTRVSWSVRGFDGVSGAVERVAARIGRHLQAGAIVLLHEGAPHGRSVAIARRTLELLRERGLATELPGGLTRAGSDARSRASC